jgi:sugar lactone lactonase YvrE
MIPCRLHTTGLVALAIAVISTVRPAHGETYQWETFAGNTGGRGASDGPVATAHFGYSTGLASDGAGNLYVADSGTSIIRKITPDGMVSTLAGTADLAGSTDGTGSAALFNGCSGVTATSGGVVYVADTNNHTIRRITAAGVVSTFAGSPGQSGSTNGTGSAARFHAPVDLTVDSAGNVYVADRDNHAIRKISPAGAVTTLAGNPAASGSFDGIGSAARFRNPEGIVVDAAGTLYVSDTLNPLIRKVTATGAVTTLAGTAGMYGTADGTGAAARFIRPRGIKLDAAGNLIVADSNTETIRKVTPGGVVTTLAGGANIPGFVDGTGSAVRFDAPTGIALDAAGNIYIADTFNFSIRKMTPAGAVTTLSGGPKLAGSTDGAGTAARFNQTGGCAMDAAGNLYVADSINCTIRRITPAGMVTTLAGSPGVQGSANGTGSAARFYRPAAVAVDTAGNLFVADTMNHTIRRITPAGVVTTFAGVAGDGRTINGTGAGARFNWPAGIAVAPNGMIYVTESEDFIRRITPAGVVTTFAGNGESGSTDGTGTAARFNNPHHLATDAAGNVFVADTISRTIRRITPAGVVSTLAGSPLMQGHLDGTGSAARFRLPSAVAVDAAGNVYVADMGSHTVRKITPGAVVTTIGGIEWPDMIADGPGLASRFTRPAGIACTPGGIVYVADTDNYRIVRGTVIPPEATAQSVAIAEDTPAPITLTGTDIDGDPLTFAIVTPPAHGTLTGSGAARIYTPAADYNGPDSFTFKTNDGTLDSAPATVSLNITPVNDAPAFTGVLPDIDAGPAAPDASYDLRPLLRDPDVGDSHTWRVTNVSNSAIFASLEVTDGLLAIRYAPYLSGSSTVEVEVADAAGETARMTVSVMLPVLPAPEVTASEALRLNRQTGLWEHRITLTNNAQRAIGGLEVAVGGLPADASLYNASDSLGANPLAGYYQPVAAGATVTMVLEYYSPSRSSALQPVLTTSDALPRNPPSGAPGGLAVDRVLPLSGPALLLEFTAVPGRRYAVQYSADGTVWLDSPVPVRAAGTRVQWIDQGLPRTSTPPPPGGTRFYRVREAAEAP